MLVGIDNITDGDLLTTTIGISGSGTTHGGDGSLAGFHRNDRHTIGGIVGHTTILASYSGELRGELTIDDGVVNILRIDCQRTKRNTDKRKNFFHKRFIFSLLIITLSVVCGKNQCPKVHIIYITWALGL